MLEDALFIISWMGIIVMLWLTISAVIVTFRKPK